MNPRVHVLFGSLLASILVPRVAGAQEEATQKQEEATPNKKEEDAPKPLIHHNPGQGLYFRADDDTKLRIRIAISPLLREYHREELTDADAFKPAIRRARLGFDAWLPHDLRVRFDLQIKMTQLVFRQIYGSWAPNKHFELFFGFLKPPGGLEIDNDVFEEPFSDRGAVTLFARVKQELGVKVEAEVRHTPIFYALSITRPAKNIETALEDDEPEDQVPIPKNADKADLFTSPSRWNAAWRLGVAPSYAFETSLSGNVLLRTEEEAPEFGDNFSEPYDDPFLHARAWVGVGWHVKGDVGLSLPHFRLLAATGFRQDGRQKSYDLDTGVPTDQGGHLNLQAATLTVGFTPNGRYGPAVKNAPLLEGWEILAKGEVGRIKPVDIGAVVYAGIFLGVNWQVHPELRVQLDGAYQRFNSNAETFEAPMANTTHWVTNLWAVFRI